MIVNSDHLYAIHVNYPVLQYPDAGRSNSRKEFFARIKFFMVAGNEKYAEWSFHFFERDDELFQIRRFGAVEQISPDKNDIRRQPIHSLHDFFSKGRSVDLTQMQVAYPYGFSSPPRLRQMRQ